ncbi:MAG: phytanoyl-CoA dioxygenase family protein [Acidimicrobiales bacterium]
MAGNHPSPAADGERAQPLEAQYTYVPRFEAGSAESIEYLETEGFVVIANALNEQEASTALDLTWNYLSDLGTGIDRHDPATWGDDRWPVAVHGGIIPSQGIGHSDAQWFIRSVPNVKASFAAVWDDDDLLVSFDGMALWRPTSFDPSWITNRGGSWLHIDQHPVGRPGFHCVQGLVSLLPTSPATGGNVLVPGSHRLFESIPERYSERLAKIHPAIDHFRFPADDPQLIETPPIMAHMEAGDLLLWDSRTIHCSSPGLEQPDVEQPGIDQPGIEQASDATDADRHQLLRAASLVCMMPKARSTPEIMAQRRAALAKRTSTTNWSDRFIDADQFPQILAAPDPGYQLPPVPRLSAEQMEMVG